jgi:hypothetical protein
VGSSNRGGFVALEGVLYYDGMYIATGNSSNLLKKLRQRNVDIAKQRGGKDRFTIMDWKRFAAFGSWVIIIFLTITGKWEPLRVSVLGGLFCIHKFNYDQQQNTCRWIY